MFTPESHASMHMSVHAYALAPNLMDFEKGDGVMVIGGNHTISEDTAGTFVRLTAFGNLHTCADSELQSWPLEVLHYWQQVLRKK